MAFLRDNKYFSPTKNTLTERSLHDIGSSFFSLLLTTSDRLTNEDPEKPMAQFKMILFLCLLHESDKIQLKFTSVNPVIKIFECIFNSIESIILKEDLLLKEIEDLLKEHKGKGPFRVYFEYQPRGNEIRLEGLWA